MANTNAQMAEFAENLWNNYIREKHNQENADAVSFYRAKVTARPGGNFLTIQRPYDNAITVPCTTAMKTAAVGAQVLVIRFGNGNNNANHLVVATGDGESQNMARYYGIVTNLDTVFDNGTYTYASSATGSPDTATGGTLVVYRFNDDYIVQIAYKNSSVNAAMSTIRQYSSGTWGAWRPFDQTLEGLASTDGSSFAKNFKLISTTNQFVIQHQRAAFGWTLDTKSEYSNIPDVLNVNTLSSVVGIREVFWKQTSGGPHVLVKVTEMYPIQGRQHYIFYNQTSWGVWHSIMPNDYSGYDLNLDNMGPYRIYGTFYVVMDSSSVAGTKPDTAAQGTLFCVKQSSDVYRQIFYPNTTDTASHYTRYYTYSTSKWSSWTTYYKAGLVQTTEAVGSDTDSIESSTSWVGKGTKTFGAGTWMIKFEAVFAANSSGKRSANISTSVGGANWTETMYANPIPGDRTIVSVTTYRQFTEDTTLYFNVSQNSGSALVTYGRLQYIRL